MAEPHRRPGCEPGRGPDGLRPRPGAGDAGRAAARECLGYLEAHIEQRPLLDNAGIPLGVVSSIAAQRCYNVRVIGEPRHVGTPYSMRHDALAGAGEAVVAIEQLGAADPTLAAVVGDLRVRGGAFNIVPGRVDFTLDVRTSDSEGQDRFERALTEALAHACVARGLKWEREVPHASPEAKCSPRMRRAISRGCAQAGVQAPLTLFSPAGHDAMGMARITDMGMLFLRNENGRSHAPEESVTRDDVAIGLVAFREAIRSLGGGR